MIIITFKQGKIYTIIFLSLYVLFILYRFLHFPPHTENHVPLQVGHPGRHVLTPWWCPLPFSLMQFSSLSP